MSFMRRLLAIALVVAVAPFVFADQTTTIHARVVSSGGDPVGGATVNLPELRLTTTTDADGHFTFTGLPAGSYLVNVTSSRFGGAVTRLATTTGDAPLVEVELDRLVHSGGISVTAAGIARGIGEVTTPVDVLAGEDLQVRKQSSLGETLAQQPGVTASSYGQGSSRPVIRGLGQDRVRILENGLDTGDVSSIGPDHAVSVDPLAAEQIEVVRGPATVLWGANAIGGVVNILDDRVPDHRASAPLSGTAELEYGSNADKKAGAVKLSGGGGEWAWHLDGFARDQDDHSSPAPRLEDEHHHDEGDEDEGDEHEHEEPELGGSGTVENTFTEAQGATAGVSYVGDRGFIGVAVGGYDTEYGIPGHHHHHEDEGEGEHEEEAAVYSDLEQRRVDLHSQLDDPFTGFEAARLSVGWRDYQHDEVEGSELGTRFENQWTEGRLDLHNAPVLGFAGTVGLQYVNRDFAAAGEEAFVEPTDTDKLGLFLFQQSEPKPVGFQVGLRWDRQDVTIADPELPDRDFSTWTASLGTVWQIAPGLSLAASLTRPERAPTAEELYSDGPHAATAAYEIGNPELVAEVGQSLDLTLRFELGRFEATLTPFVTRYDDFIYQAETGEEIDELEVLRFVQQDADFRGFELHGHLELLHTASDHLHLGFSYDQVRAELRDASEALPRIPPRRAQLALVWLADRWDARLEGWWVDDQERVAEHETATPGYEMVNASVGYKIFAGSVVHELLLRGRNLLDEEAYNHVSFLKLQAPLPGRDVSLVYRTVF